MIVANIAAIAQMGCGVDLDDFGTGHASITSIRRFAVRRLKIDRSFVTRVDEDREQQKIVSAILSMAERLEMETIAEGVETQGEHAMLSQLGCNHVQGYGLARPMAFEETVEWMHRYTGQRANHHPRGETAQLTATAPLQARDFRRKTASPPLSGIGRTSWQSGESRLTFSAALLLNDA